MEELFKTGKIQVLVCTATLAWGVNLPAHLVVIKGKRSYFHFHCYHFMTYSSLTLIGTEFFDPKTKRYTDMPITDVLQMMGRAGRPQYDNTGVSVVLVHEPKKAFYTKVFFFLTLPSSLPNF